eukprot:m.19523 g.19523  ORF g.19523 m.19523 type:complete len:170 (+) comp8043_c0_seq1:876-1385(+)
MYTLTNHTENVYDLVVTSDEQVLFSASADYDIRVWNMTRQPPECMYTLTDHTTLVFALAISPDDTRLYSGSSHNEGIFIWDITQMPPVKIEKIPVDSFVLDLFLAPGRLYGACTDGTVRMWSLATFPPTFRRTMSKHTGGAHALTMDTNATRLFSAGSDSTVKEWSVCW